MSQAKLTLSCPQTLAEQVTEYLVDHESVTTGFITVVAHSHGCDFASATLRELVRGRVQSTLLIMILPVSHVTPLLAELRQKFRAPRMLYWTEPVHEFGDFS